MAGPDQQMPSRTSRHKAKVATSYKLVKVDEPNIRQIRDSEGNLWFLEEQHLSDDTRPGRDHHHRSAKDNGTTARGSQEGAREEDRHTGSQMDSQKHRTSTRDSLADVRRGQGEHSSWKFDTQYEARSCTTPRDADWARWAFNATSTKKRPEQQPARKMRANNHTSAIELEERRRQADHDNSQSYWQSREAQIEDGSEAGSRGSTTPRAINRSLPAVKALGQHQPSRTSTDIVVEDKGLTSEVPLQVERPLVRSNATRRTSRQHPPESPLRHVIDPTGSRSAAGHKTSDGVHKSESSTPDINDVRKFDWSSMQSRPMPDIRVAMTVKIRLEQDGRTKFDTETAKQQQAQMRQFCPTTTYRLPQPFPPLSKGANIRFWRRIHGILAFLLAAVVLYTPFLTESPNTDEVDRAIAQCASITTPAGPGLSYSPASRALTGSDRHVVGTPPTLIRNAKIWTGVHNGTEVIYGDILLDKGVVISVGSVSQDQLVRAKAASTTQTVDIFDAEGRWVTPGIVDLHSHIGVSSAPLLQGSTDSNSKKGLILPWLRSIDSLNTHDESYVLAVAGGVTTAQVLPGSANNIGGQSFLIKLRSTEERSAISKVLEPPQSLIANQTSDYLPWRHMKHACGENPSRVYTQSRMDSAWKFREAYESARKLKVAQDAFCSRVESLSRSKRSWLWPSSWLVQNRRRAAALGDFPQDLQWEALVDVLRGRVKAVDLDAIVRLSNEFKFPVASFHHAGETYLVPELLKKTWGGAPSIALFASNARKKREAYRNSEFAPKILADNGFPVIMKSDHPVLNSRYLMYEAQQAHYYGLDANLALLSVTSTPAKAAGVGHRVGSLGVGYDADVVIWDSHPLALGATPVQVYIDGISQIAEPEVLVKSEKLQNVPSTPNWDVEALAAVEYEGLPPLRGRKVRLGEFVGESLKRGVKFVGVKSAWVQDVGGVRVLFDKDEDKDASLHTTTDTTGMDTVNSLLVLDGSLIPCTREALELCSDDKVQEVVDLQGGSLAPGLTTFGSRLGMVEILLEASTSDGVARDPLVGSSTGNGVPDVVGGDEAVVRAVDGLQFEGRNTLLAYRSGVTRAISVPISNGFLAGLSTAFDTGASHALERGAVVKEETALHVMLNQLLDVSVSTQAAALRRLLYHSTSDVWRRVQMGEIPLVVNVDSADIMSTLLRLKSEYETHSGNTIRLTFTGAAEAHLLADQISEAGVSVVITSPRPYPGSWQERRIIPGPPLSRDSILTALLSKNVNVAIGVRDDFDVRNGRFNLAWAALESNGTISKTRALEIATTNLDRALGVERVLDIVAYRGGTMFNLESRVAAVVSVERGTVEIF
ncbi:hypothetical protein C0995_009994 [Termitomyces sp. Mi166|nr:hypothetical protein C0995_009994 [Termitomyces sp. Mi166\